MFVKYVKVLLLTPTIGSLLVCSLGIAAGGVFLARVGAANRASKREAPQPNLSRNNLPRASNAVASSALPVALQISYSKSSQQKRAILQRASPALATTMSDADRTMLLQYVGTPAMEAIRSEKFRYFVDSVIPYAPIHYHVDVPLTQALEEVLAISTEPAELRDRRYLMLTTTASERFARRGFLWVDLQSGAAFGGIFFWPSNGEPSPTLTLFSKQVKSAAVRTHQLPASFLKDLQRWSVAANLPPVTVRYFVGATDRKSVLLHEENYCGSKPAVDGCELRNEEAAAIDAKAAAFLEQVHYASNATGRMITSVPVSAVRPQTEYPRATP